MKTHVLLIGAIMLILSGCTSHYYKVKEDMVHIYLKRPNAKDVFFVSSLDGYELHKAKHGNDRIWEATAPAHREFKYFYIVDGVAYLPPCRVKETDDFGSESCIYVPDM